MLIVDRLNVFYRNLQALHDVSITIAEKEIVGVIGANGGGKSTLVRSISGLVRPTSGRISFNEIDILGCEPQRIIGLGIVQIPEGRKIFNNLTVVENLELGAYLKEKKKKRKETLERVFSIFPVLQDRRNLIAATLSGGEQQMLAIGRGLMALPKLLMLDEPSLGLAPKIVEEVFEIMSELNRNGTTILLIEQHVHKTVTLAGRSYVLENGKIVLEGDKNRLLDSEHVIEAYLGI